ncbi:MAG: hypothetical protein ACFFG0_24410 [Candidatus Thorarchaeota archaeon]
MTRNKQITCKFDRVVSLKLLVKHLDYYKPLYKTIDLKKWEREDQTLRLNMEFGNTEKCQCERCNPNTSKGAEND